MADCGFDIQDDRTLINVKLNIPPFLKDKDQFTEVEMVQTWRIASCVYHKSWRSRLASVIILC